MADTAHRKPFTCALQGKPLLVHSRPGLWPFLLLLLVLIPQARLQGSFLQEASPDCSQRVGCVSGWSWATPSPRGQGLLTVLPTAWLTLAGLE